MRLSDFRVGWRLLLRQPLYSAVLVLGLALGFAASFLLLGYVQYSFSYDRQTDGVYIFKHKLNLLAQPQWTEQMPLPAHELLTASGMVAQSSVLMPQEVLVEQGGQRQRMELTAVNIGFPELMRLSASAGDLHAALSRPDGLALTRSAAHSLFGAVPALGRTVQAKGRTLRVLALLPDPPPNTTIHYRALVGVGSALWTEAERSRKREAWNALAGKVLVRPAANVKPEALRALVQADGERFMRAMVGTETAQGMGTLLEVRLEPLSDAYFDTSVAVFLGGQRADRRLVLALGGVAVLILLLAAGNYVNLATVRMLARQREIGIRKALGASLPRLAGQIVAESVTVALLAALAGLMLAWLLLPVFSELVDRKLDAYFNFGSLPAALAIGLQVGVASALYPLRIALRVRPQSVLVGRGDGEPPQSSWLRRGLTLFQFAAAMALTAMALAVAWQSRFAAQADPGFDLAGLALIDMPPAASAQQKLAFREAVAHLPRSDGAEASNLAIGDSAIPMSRVYRAGGAEKRLNFTELSPGFFRLYGIAPQEGRLFDAERGAEGQQQDVVLNAAAAQALGFAQPQAAVGKALRSEDHAALRVVGIAPALRHQSARLAAQPMVYHADAGQADVLSVRSAHAPEILRVQIAPLWQRYFPQDELALRSARSVFEANYVDDWRAARLLAWSSAVAIVIAAFGIYVLAASSVQCRVREIALRKLHGANRRRIALLVGREFLILLALATLLGLPLAAAGIARYLAEFAERAPLGAWPLFGAWLAASIVALLACSRHTWRAMKLSPATALRG
ncbi:FtsX-like permease family protein [Massilia sp. BJB1822]|uniref:FtsX-like permease family protein n=1 Tax=Massilia sp. BJB1822 TaxID=2744470 RepID=UPI0015945744|nr:FtsX-like permease family protein [Massilia sp. BJB1822]NVE00759.1 ABC transporter permease [Massilia sp. BJB1822]